MTPPPLDPEIEAFLEGMRQGWAAHPPFASLSFPEQRAVAEQVRAQWVAGGPEMARTIDRTFDPGAGELRIRVHIPAGAADPSPALIYIHGGGFTLFSIDTHDRVMREYADRGGFAVIGVDYPLSPEARYPEALNRIEGLLNWLADRGGELGIDPARMALGGDSAGANLSFATALRLRARGRIGQVRAILSNYGYFIAEVSDEAEARFGGPGSIMDRAEALQYFTNYFDRHEDAADPQACPLLADLTDFPPVLLVVPECDILAEQSFAMEARLRAAGVAADSIVYSGATHSFLEAMSVAGVARRGLEDGARFIAAHLG